MFRTIFIASLSLIILGCTQNVKKPKPLMEAPAITKRDLNLDNYFLNSLNSIRVKGTKCSKSAPPLRLNDALKKAAFTHAKDMGVNNFLGHSGSGTVFDVAKKKDGKKSSFLDRVIFFGYKAKAYDLIGEVVTKTKFKSSKLKDIKTNFKVTLNKLLKDPTHCKILTNPRFKDVGFGYYKTNNTYYWVIDLGETKESKK